MLDVIDVPDGAEKGSTDGELAVPEDDLPHNPGDGEVFAEPEQTTVDAEAEPGTPFGLADQLALLGGLTVALATLASSSLHGITGGKAAVMRDLADRGKLNQKKPLPEEQKKARRRKSKKRK